MQAEENTSEQVIITPTKGDLFLEEYIANGFNGTRAALAVFDINGETEEQRANTAGVIAHTYLRKDKIQQKLRERMQRTDVSIEWLVSRLKAHADNMDNPQYSMQAIDRLAHLMGKELKPTQKAATGDQATQIIFNLPTAPDKQALPQGAVIDVEPSG